MNRRSLVSAEDLEHQIKLLKQDLRISRNENIHLKTQTMKHQQEIKEFTKTITNLCDPRNYCSSCKSSGASLSGQNARKSVFINSLKSMVNDLRYEVSTYKRQNESLQNDKNVNKSQQMK
jgi:phage shock protein A